MKTKLIIAAATFAGAVLIKYLMNKTTVAQQPAKLPAKKNHHLTGVFAHAKNHHDQ